MGLKIILCNVLSMHYSLNSVNNWLLFSVLHFE